HDFLQDWLPYRDTYLAILLKSNVPPDPRICSKCSTEHDDWQCLECFGRLVTCTDCCQLVHLQHPFHRVQKWGGWFFVRSSLREVGIKLELGHAGRRCPNHISGETEENQGEDQEDEMDWEEYTLSRTSSQFQGIGKNSSMLTIVDMTGIHHLVTDSPFVIHLDINWCGCDNCPPHDQQLLSMGLYPASTLQPQMEFTFRVLDDYLLTNKECKTSAMSYYSRLRRVMDNALPQQVPVHKLNKLLRASRQWRNLKYQKWHDFGHDPVWKVGSGDLAIFCAACPQPGVNLQDEWEQDPDQWKYSRNMVMDSNFTAEHLRMRRSEDDVWLGDGHGFMVTNARHKRHLALAKESKQKSTCHDHRAVHQANADRHNLEVTGIGAAACGHHGCFFPSSVVDFQKGERQMNMDYVLSQATIPHVRQAVLCHMKGIHKVLLMYDIMCQYQVHLQDRVRDNPYLSIPDGLQIQGGIGQFHVHGHQSKCYPRYSPAFMEGAGQLDGEVIETLWAPLNNISGSTRGMSTAHCREVIDDHMNDLNWKKMTGLVPSLFRKWKKAMVSITSSTVELRDMEATASNTKLMKCDTENHPCPPAQRGTPIIPQTSPPGARPSSPTRQAIQLKMMKEESQGKRGQGITAWLSMGIQAQEKQ
ncbi:hypothetical protein WOLCODRAFT_85463, partial [Wolfiporia cocos MD-104 SS10]